jgi:hypothetical protein
VWAGIGMLASQIEIHANRSVSVVEGIGLLVYNV